MNFCFNIYAFEESHTSSTFRRYATQYMKKASFIYFIFLRIVVTDHGLKASQVGFSRDATVYSDFMIYVPFLCRATE